MERTEKFELLEKIRKLIVNRYVIDEKAKHVDAMLSQYWESGRYDHLLLADSFASALTDDLRELSNDAHLRVSWSEEAHVMEPEGQVVREQNDRRKHCEDMAFGISKVERLDQNIGYIGITELVELSLSAEAFSAAMTLVANCNALIIDLRKCCGGDPATVAWISSYLFDQRTQLSTLVVRAESRTEQYWTHDWVPGRRFGQTKPVYVLMANYTFSGAEMLAYDLQSHKRAKIVGEVSGGGAHACQFYWPTPNFALLLPECQPQSPVTGSNWENTGVQPDFLTDEGSALPKAIQLAQLNINN